jgi:hypothetical protein
MDAGAGAGQRLTALQIALAQLARVRPQGLRRIGAESQTPALTRPRGNLTARVARSCASDLMEYRPGSSRIRSTGCAVPVTSPRL